MLFFHFQKRLCKVITDETDLNTNYTEFNHSFHSRCEFDSLHPQNPRNQFIHISAIISQINEISDKKKAPLKRVP